MQVMSERAERGSVAIDQSALALGLDEFSLLSRLQTGEIAAVRARSGEMMIPDSELQRLGASQAAKQSVGEGVFLPDHRLGIDRGISGLKRSGEHRHFYRVAGSDERFSESEINAYRAAFSAIAERVDVLRDLTWQLNGSGQLPDSCDSEVNTPQTGLWDVRSALLNLNTGEILLCQQGDEFAVIERFGEASPYRQANGSAQILLRGSDPHQLTEAFKADAKRTLEFMASNLAAKAQRIVWEQFPEQRPGEIVAAISQRCHQAITNVETISQTQGVRQTVSPGISI